MNPVIAKLIGIEWNKNKIKSEGWKEDRQTIMGKKDRRNEGIY